MKKLLKYLKDYKRESVLGPLFKLLEACFELLVPLVMAKVIDVGIKSQDMPYVLKMGGLLVLLGITGLACSITAQYFAAKAAAGFGTALRNDLFAHINRLSYQEIDSIGTATLITRITSDANQVQSGVNLFLRLFLRSPFVVCGAMIMSFTIDVRAAFIFVVLIPLLSFVIFGIMLLSIPLYKKVQKQLDQVLLTVRENLEGVRVIRAFARQNDEVRRFDGENSLLVRFQVFVGKISALMNPLTYVMINLGIIVLINTGAGQVQKGIITQGEVIALVNYMSQILVELVKLANLIITISKSLACGSRISAVFEQEPGIVETVHRVVEGEQGAAEVEFDHMSFAYCGAKETALNGISIQVKRGETIGIIGGTGSGKTTLVNLIPRFYDVTEGSVKVCGVDVKQYSLGQLRELVGIVPQKAVLFKGTLRDNMKWGKKNATDDEIYQALAIAQAKDFVEEKGQGLELMIQAGGKNLSGGQKQRLAIARALVKDPQILIMDDSASALDFATDAKLRKAIKQNTRDMTVFLVSQRAATIKNADKILVLDDGQMAGWGNHKELLASCEVYREICLSQLAEEEVQ
ncbi:ABC transporter ATP-binding protein [Lacrimispora saccharolytica]|uniref:ABC transporter related protein n=1 Tax=Lacrimispora saccharolytica (strain ATCC 35040 / DSM 2544 / NRCC 2533 / WM1) TaxID=610130 RepID=D9R351_LACSW|nr:ABC transporter ATP-binding protein [Lacrimispora saccharolytica]ADL04800.1 ABC transporter related protein [[Clostridium] saccharolyticum WM1]QRV20986.1 ABC transporter ATP-binding protein [Lacrimispora saccharolytica]